MKCITCLQNKKLALHVYVQPRASRNRFAGLYGNAAKLCITAPPVDNKANGAVLVFLSKLFGIPKSAMQIKSGRQSRNKQIIISGLSLTQAQKALEAALET
jgi:uncharacterized protein (TIGR00251 family)